MSVTSSRKRSPAPASTSSCMNREICAARCQEPPSRSTLSSSNARPMGRLRATAITRQVKKLPMGCLPRRRRLSTRLERWLSSQALTWLRRSGPSSGVGAPAFFGAAPTRCAGCGGGMRVALIRPPRRRSGDHVAGSACGDACARSGPGRGWRSARWYPDG